VYIDWEAGPMHFRSDTTERIVFTAGGDIQIATAGAGIDFSAQASPAAGMSSELLNRYEEGSWTPTIIGPTSISYASQTGAYTRIGRLVAVQFWMKASWTASVSQTYIGGLPFTVGSPAGANIDISHQSVESGVVPTFYAQSGTTTAKGFQQELAGGSWVAPTASLKIIVGSGTYLV